MPSHQAVSGIHAPLVGQTTLFGGQASHKHTQDADWTRRVPAAHKGHVCGLHWAIPPRTQIHEAEEKHGKS